MILGSTREDLAGGVDGERPRPSGLSHRTFVHDVLVLDHCAVLKGASSLQEHADVQQSRPGTLSKLACHGGACGWRLKGQSIWFTEFCVAMHLTKRAIVIDDESFSASATIWSDTIW